MLRQDSRENWFVNRIKKIGSYFAACYDAKVEVLSNAIMKEYLQNDNKGSSWEAMWSIDVDDWYKTEQVNWQGQEILFEGIDSQLNGRNCKNDWWQKIKVNGAGENKLKSIKIPNPKKLVFSQVDNSNIRSSGKIKSYSPKIMLLKTNEVKPHKGKIRLMKISKGENYWYIDWWVKAIKNYELKFIEEYIKNTFNCEMGDDEGSENQSSCQLITQIIEETFDLKSILRSTNVESPQNQTVEKGWCINNGESTVELKRGNCEYGVYMKDHWEHIKQELGRNWVILGQEIGLVWEGKEFKWRSF
ncbi:hypothetical protein [Mycoplasma parvum]|uniref:Uncharacterized protein n=1 Tax=Mycoplasma parvum str. Indiana TaxID=1403316 RepID=U5NC04_9MOLU|nr:hypothetical protein [Mycoplasma parvum]AGX88932.1 hypothetical protein PRV_00835 [Mycoplasma parvum str. Indiana]